jgi:hypothetical protein
VCLEVCWLLLRNSVNWILVYKFQNLSDDFDSPPLSPGSSDIQCCTIGSASGMYGLDIADPASVTDYSCFSSSGFGDFTVPRGFRSTGAIDTNVCTNLKNAQSAGVKYRDVYMFPCPVNLSLPNSLIMNIYLDMLE